MMPRGRQTCWVTVPRLNDLQKLRTGQEWAERINRGTHANVRRGGTAGGGAVTQALVTPAGLQHGSKDRTRPPPCSTQDGATEGCSAVWNQPNKLLLQPGREISQRSQNKAPTHPRPPVRVTSQSAPAPFFLTFTFYSPDGAETISNQICGAIINCDLF